MRFTPFFSFICLILSAQPHRFHPLQYVNRISVKLSQPYVDVVSPFQVLNRCALNATFTGRKGLAQSVECWMPALAARQGSSTASMPGMTSMNS